MSILGIRWFDFVSNALVMDQVKQRPICSRIRDRRITMFGHVRRLQESVPAHEALRLAVNTRTGVRPDDRLDCFLMLSTSMTLNDLEP